MLFAWLLAISPHPYGYAHTKAFKALEKCLEQIYSQKKLCERTLSQIFIYIKANSFKMTTTATTTTSTMVMVKAKRHRIQTQTSTKNHQLQFMNLIMSQCACGRFRFAYLSLGLFRSFARLPVASLSRRPNKVYAVNIILIISGV